MRVSLALRSAGVAVAVGVLVAVAVGVLVGVARVSRNWSSDWPLPVSSTVGLDEPSVV